MNQAIVKEKLYQRYIEPTKHKREDFIGVEIELPVLNMNREAVDFNAVHTVTKSFLSKFGFIVSGMDDEGNIYLAEDKLTGDTLSFDCSYNNLELSMGRERSLDDIYTRFRTYFLYLQEELGKYNHMLTGMGVNPYRKYNKNEPIPNGRYRMLYHHLSSYKSYYNMPMYFHKHPEYGMFSSASQVQLDIDYENLLRTINLFSKLEPVKSLLFSNSVLLGENEELLCCRDMMWENSTHGINPHNIGMFDCRFEKIDELISYIESMSVYCVERDGRYINFQPIKIMEYFEQPYVEGEYYDGNGYRKVRVTPEIGDIEYLRSFKFEDITFRGTVEFRSVCCQPVSDCMTVAAFHLGIKNNLQALEDLLDNDEVIYGHGYTASELRKMFNKRELPYFLDMEKLYQLCRGVVDISAEGLRKRGFKEERMLEPLYIRIEKRTNPAKSMLDRLETGEIIENIIKDYGSIDLK